MKKLTFLFLMFNINNNNILASDIKDSKEETNLSESINKLNNYVSFLELLEYLLFHILKQYSLKDILNEINKNQIVEKKFLIHLIYQ